MPAGRLTRFRGEQMIKTLYRKILIPTDGSDNTKAAIGYAIDLARQSGAEVTAISVNDISNYATIPGEPDIQSPLYQASKEAVQYVIETAAAQGVHVEGMVVDGIPKRDIVEASKDYDLIVMGTIGRSGLPHLLLGSVAEKVIRNARCPVLVVRAGSVRPVFKCERVLIPSDGKDNSLPAVKEGLELAKACGAEVTALSVSDEAGKAIGAKGRNEGDASPAEAAVDQVVEEGKKLGISVTRRLVIGSPADAIIDASAEQDLVVMGTHGRSGLAHLRLGSVAEKVIRDALCPVLVVKGGRSRRKA